MVSSLELSKKGYTCPDLLSACCMYDCSSLKCQRCIQKYCCCCYLGISSHTSDLKYPHIAYGRIQLRDKEMFEVREKVQSPLYQKVFHHHKPVEKGIKSVPYQTIFQYPQPQHPYSIHPQLDQSSQFDSDIHVPSIVNQQPHSDGCDSDKPQDFMNKKQPSDFSPYGSMDDIGAKIGFVDMSMYVGSNETDSLCIPQRCESGPGLVCRGRSTSPLLPSIPSINVMGMELQKKSLQPVYPSSEVPCIHFSLYHDEYSQKLIVHLKQAFKLPTSRPVQSCNPFAEVYLLPKKNYVHKSRVLMKTHNPVFDETFKFTDLSLHAIRKQTILMRMYVNERSHFIGGLLYPLESANMNGDLIKVPISVFDEEESLKGSCCGDILLSLCYHSKAETLEVVIIEINNLKKLDFIGLSNPYVKVNLMQQDERIIKWKTTVKKNTLTPVFYESTQFNIAAIDLKRVHFDILIMDHDRVGRNSTIGIVRLGYKVDHMSGETQWQHALNNPNHLCSTWHSIHPLQKGKSSIQRRSKSPSCINVGTQI